MRYARDAMIDGGKLIISISSVTLTPEDLLLLTGKMSLRASGKSKSFGVITITDTGKGMDEETQTHIFEPFYTTKNIKMSTGLGLSTTYGIINQHNGYTRVTSDKGIGTTFFLYLPLAEDLPDANNTSTATNTSSSTKGKPIVLIIEDDNLIRNILARYLIKEGFAVLEAENLKQALSASKQYSGNITLVLCDIFLKGETGQNIIQELKKQYPEIKFLYESGYPKETLIDKGIISADDPIIFKPFSADALISKIKSIIEKK